MSADYSKIDSPAQQQPVTLPMLIQTCPVLHKPIFCTNPLASMFVLVPSKVQVPPKIDAYDSGIKSLEGLIDIARAWLNNTGSSITTTGVLLTKADAKPTVKTSKNNYLSISQLFKAAEKYRDLFYYTAFV